ILRCPNEEKVLEYGPADKARDTFNDWFYQGLRNPADYHLKPSDEESKQWIDFDINNINYGIVLANMCLSFALAFEPRQKTDDMIEYAKKRFNIYVGYQLAILAMKKKTKEKKAASGKGQKRAMARRIEALEDKMRPVIKTGGDTRIDKGEFYQLLCEQFKGSEKTPRDPKTVKAYRKAIEDRNKSKIVWEKGAIIPENGPSSGNITP
ncbi:MAG: hypothetical protein L7F78_12865, partial [Syntrophales bacterium LBB04]|nr:hypothetical protein [Syntrophales bacterium LBB04]